MNSKNHFLLEVRDKARRFTVHSGIQRLSLPPASKKQKICAEDDEIQIYLSAGDKELADCTQCKDRLYTPRFFRRFSSEGSARRFRRKNILIDNSFATNLEAMRKEFKFDGGLNHE